MNRDTTVRLRRAIVLGLVVTTAIVTTSAVAALEQPVLPPGATLEPATPSAVQPALPPGATLEPATPSAVQPALPPGATLEPATPSAEQPALPPGATLEPATPSTGPLGGVQVAPVPSSPGALVQGGFDWADAGIGAGIAFGSILLVGGALLVVRGQRHRLATH